MINERSKTPLCEYKQAGCLPNAIGQAAVLVTSLNPMARAETKFRYILLCTIPLKSNGNFKKLKKLFKNVLFVYDHLFYCKHIGARRGGSSSIQSAA